MGLGGGQATHDDIYRRHKLSYEIKIVEICRVVVAGELYYCREPPSSEVAGVALSKVGAGREPARRRRDRLVHVENRTSLVIKLFLKFFVVKLINLSPGKLIKRNFKTNASIAPFGN
ncbi:hypothetical protein AVEN_179854-1 [Araneus ventricosus]|uniref:Uncharacterized protein n=1 Tax=Araneus ventricosus TaxID=182803 RepID=A0A4Y2LIZ5_ARAVE|nr:hypothetical protein AVEN_179854-1 [Araneus ventricosus]